MLMSTPKFWYQSDINIILKCLLYPISLIYMYCAKLNYQRKYKYYSKKSDVIAIGGLTVGGSGKTLVAISLCEILNKIKKKSAVLSRGFGRLSQKTILVDNIKHTFIDVGDEPLLLSHVTDVFVGKNRAKSAQIAEQQGHNLLILDDGLTQRYLYPNVKFIVIDNLQQFGNGYMLPLGPNRLNFEIIKNEVQAIIILKNSPHEDIEKLRSKIPPSISVLIAYIEQDYSGIKPNEQVIAFCGIGYPEKFFRPLEQKLRLIKKISFPDHHPFTDDDIINLLDIAKTHKAKLLTTEKDFVRIPKKYRAFINTVSAKIVWQNTGKLISYLKSQALFSKWLSSQA